MLKVHELLDRTSKVVSSVAAISLSLAVIAVSAVVVKENVKDLLRLKKVRAHVICINPLSDTETQVKKESSKKGGSKKGGSKSAATEGESTTLTQETK